MTGLESHPICRYDALIATVQKISTTRHYITVIDNFQKYGANINLLQSTPGIFEKAHEI